MTYSTWAADVASDDGDCFSTEEISRSALVAGTNVLAVEVHQADAGSSDVSFDLELLGLSVPGTASGAFLRGDSNDDGRVDISDAVHILVWMFADGTTPGCLAATNANGDAGTDISDALYMLNYLFKGGEAPVAPYPECGPGTLPTDAESCETTPVSCR